VAEWWQKPYPMGPLVVVKGFPRSLFPPDATKQGKKPSVDGPDVIAYKRAVSRLGRWPWTTFDDTFSNAFSHGKSGNVKETGLAGFQRQQHIDGTGWVGKPTFNALRAARIPSGLPNAGKPAFDAECIRLINTAFVKFQGNEPDPAAATTRQAALKKAITQIGVVESPRGTNRQKYGVWYGMNGVPWCAIFVAWCYENSGKASPSFAAGSRYSYVPSIVGDARAGRNGLRTTGDPIAGDLVCYDWNRDGIHDHVGIFEKWTNARSAFSAVEGNTGAASASNGGQVMRAQRYLGGIGVVFVRVAEPK
jgi:CHAP domain-containing protein